MKKHSVFLFIMFLITSACFLMMNSQTNAQKITQDTNIETVSYRGISNNLIVTTVTKTINNPVTEAKTSSNQETVDKLYKVGESAIIGPLEFTLLEAYEKKEFPIFKKIPEGATYVVVKYKYKNISKESLSSFWGGVPVRINFEDYNGSIYSTDIDANLYVDYDSDEKSLSKLNPGITTKGGDVYEVAIETTYKKGNKLRVNYDNEYYGYYDLDGIWNRSSQSINSNYSNSSSIYFSGSSSTHYSVYNLYSDVVISPGDILYVSSCDVSVSLRKTPSTNAVVINQVPICDSVKYLGYTDNGFLLVDYKGKEGYILTSYLDCYEPEIWAANSGQIINVDEYASLRSLPSTSASVYTKIPLGATVSNICYINDQFYRVSYNGYTGYVLKSLVATNDNIYDSSSTDDVIGTYHCAESDGYATIELYDYINLQVSTYFVDAQPTRTHAVNTVHDTYIAIGDNKWVSEHGNYILKYNNNCITINYGDYSELYYRTVYPF